jgi:hypothetical protein
MQRPIHLWLTLALCLTAVFALYVPVGAQDEFKDLRKEYEQAKTDGQRTAMGRLIDKMAATNQKDAAKYLLAELDADQKARKAKKAGLPGDVRDKIVDGLSRFTDEESVGLIGKAALNLDSNKTPILALDQFDFFKSLARMEGVAAADKTLREALQDPKNPYIKCAALEAIRQAAAKRFLDDVCNVLREENELWSKTWLIVPINTLACLEELVEPEETEAAIKVVEAVIAWQKRTLCTDERVHFFGGKMLFKVTNEVADMSSIPFWEWWVKQMQFAGKVDDNTKKPEKRSKTAALPPVFDTAPVGRRFVFVIDVSKSMELPLKITLAEIEKRKEERGPVTGKRDPKQQKEDAEKEKEAEGAAEKEKNKDEENPLRQLPWEEISTKIELAREELSRAIKTFEGDREFAIVTYSTEVEVITDGWIKATAANCSKWSKEVKDLEPVLLTNIHGGLTRALKISSKGIDSDNPAVDSECVLTGADSIIFLTDGWASWDDQSTAKVRDKRRPNDTAEVIGNGPFIYGEDIWPDIMRQNLFRKVVINTVGIGEHDKELLRTLAARTGGTYVDWGFPEE